MNVASCLPNLLDPEIELNSWIIEHTSLGYFHNQLMGWGPTQSSTDAYDAFERASSTTTSAIHAVNRAQTIGWGVDIIYPTNRYMPRKSYASNFKWKGPPQKKEDEEDY